MLSARMSSRPMGWCREGADSLSRIRIYWKNGGDMLKLVQMQKEKGEEERKEEEKYFSAGEMLLPAYVDRQIQKLRGKSAQCIPQVRLRYHSDFSFLTNKALHPIMVISRVI